PFALKPKVALPLEPGSGTGIWPPPVTLVLQFSPGGVLPQVATSVLVKVTAAFARARPLRLPSVTVMATPERMFPTTNESVMVAASLVHQNTLLSQVSPLPGRITEKLVPVRAPVPPVPILKIQTPSAGPSSVNVVRVNVTSAALQ